MTFAQRFALVLLAAFFLSTAVTSATAWIVTSPLLRMTARFSASFRASLLAGWRLLPSAAALIATGLVLAPGYYRHEQRGEPEDVGAVLLLLAAGGAAVLASAAARAVRAGLRTAALRREWSAGSKPASIGAAGLPAFEIDSVYPLVAVLGAFRPRLFISSSVLRTCPADEIAAIVQHEHGHVRSRDNVVRLLMEAAPDLLARTPAAEATAREWHRAIEHRADDRAGDRVTLASALVRVARLSGDVRHAALPASALYRGEGVEDRVRRLVAGAADRDRGARCAAVAAALVLAAAIAAMALGPDISPLSHRLLETLVSMR